MTFLVVVNETYAPCYASGLSPPVVPGLPLRQGPHVTVGACDSGPVVYSVTPDGLLVTFGSSVIADASPPQCTIPWSDAKSRTLGYRLPLAFGKSPQLPYCALMDSREGYHMTQFTLAAVHWD